MGDSVDEILEFLQRNKFSRAEAALRGEIGGRMAEKEEIVSRINLRKQGSSGSRSEDTSSELVVKEVEVGSVRNRSEIKGVGGLNSSSVDLYPWGFSSEAAAVPSISENFSALSLSAKSGHQRMSASKNCDSSVQTHTDSLEDLSVMRTGSNKVSFDAKSGTNNQSGDLTSGVSYYTNDVSSNSWSKNDESWRECSVRTVFSFPKGNASSSNDVPRRIGDGYKDKRKIVEIIEGSEDLDRPIPFGNPHEAVDQRRIAPFDLPHMLENHKEELPRLPPVRLKSEEKQLNLHWEEKAYQHGSDAKLSITDSPFLIGSFLDVPIGQEINSSGLSHLLLLFHLFLSLSLSLSLSIHTHTHTHTRTYICELLTFNDIV